MLIMQFIQVKNYFRNIGTMAWLENFYENNPIAVIKL